MACGLFIDAAIVRCDVCVFDAVIKVPLCPHIVIVANLFGCQVLYNHRYVENYPVESFQTHFLYLPQNFGYFISFWHLVLLQKNVL